MKTIMASETPDMTSQAVFSHLLTVESLVREGAGKVNVTPTVKDIAIIRDILGLKGLRKVTLKGDLKPLGRADWCLTARLGATITQECVVTLGPVTVRIEETVERVWSLEIPDISETGNEEEISEDTNWEHLGKTIDLGQVLVEAMGLSLPPFPRAPDAVLEQNTFAAPGTTPMEDEDARPFAGLAALRDKISGKDDTSDGNT